MTGYLLVFFVISLAYVVRYFAFAGGAYWYFWRRARRNVSRRIQAKEFERQDLVRDLKASLAGNIALAVIVAIPFAPAVLPHTAIYREPFAHGAPWLLLSFLGLVVLHDFFFYWSHRLMHLTSIFPLVHRTHHLAKNPSPFSTFAFGPVEAAMHVAWILPIQFFVPVYQGVYVAFSGFFLLFNIIGHLGIELYPESWGTHPLLRWLNSSTNHNLHHQVINRNYGLYFTWWDSLMGSKYASLKKSPK